MELGCKLKQIGLEQLLILDVNVAVGRLNPCITMPAPILRCSVVYVHLIQKYNKKYELTFKFELLIYQLQCYMGTVGKMVV